MHRIKRKNSEKLILFLIIFNCSKVPEFRSNCKGIGCAGLNSILS